MQKLIRSLSLRSFSWMGVLLGLLTLDAPPSLASALSDEPSRVLYQVYVESFQDGALSDGNGDFEGIVSRIGYLKDLGITGILLMPIFDGDGFGYIPKDYYRLRQDYGDEASLKHLIDSAHAAGIKVFMDTPINHIGKDSAWFQKSESREPGFEDFFVWTKAPNPSWTLPWDPQSTWKNVFYWSAARREYYYALFGWGMPDLNHTSPNVQSEILKMFRYWSNLGVDGFRIDAAKHLVEGETNKNPLEPANLALLKKYFAGLRSTYPNTSFLLEAWNHNYSDWEPFIPESGDVGFDFSYLENLRDSVVHNHPWAVRNAMKHLEEAQDQILPGNRIVFAGNHDMPRIRTAFGDDRRKAELALTLTFLLPQTPLLYYGDELYMPGEYIRPPLGDSCRVGTPMAWSSEPNAGFTDPAVTLGTEWNKILHDGWQTLNVETESKDPDSFLSFVKTLIHARKDLPIDNQTRMYVDNKNPSDPVLTYGMIFADGSCAVGQLNFSDVTQPPRSIALPNTCEGLTPLNTLLSRRAHTISGSGADLIQLDGYGTWFGFKPGL